jgi:hypothetical protein
MITWAKWAKEWSKLNPNDKLKPGALRMSYENLYKKYLRRPGTSILPSG